VKPFRDIALAVVLTCSLLIVAWQHLSQQEEPRLVAAAPIVVATTGGPIPPIPLHIDLDDRKVVLGEKLFHDPRLSHDNSVACAHCHNLLTGGTDRLVRSTGINGAAGDVNAPTVFNSGFNFKQFWDGRAETLEDQIDGPTHAPKEMGSNWPEIVSKLVQDASYGAAFSALYADGIQSRNIKDAIATFERSLYTPNARFDQFLRGKSDALTDEEKRGYQLFTEYGCVTCHQGVGIGGNMFETFGVMGNYFADRGNETPADLGRVHVTGKEQDRHVFKVPSLRNVALTPPYFHDGSAQRLEDAVATMVKYQLVRALVPAEVDLIVLFLKTLTGEYKGKTLAADQ